MSVLRQHYSHPFAPIQIIAGDTRKTAVFCVAGYLMSAGHFSKKLVSTGDLNRSRSPEVRKPLACFLVTFCTMQKVTTRFPFREVPRFSKPRCHLRA